MLASELSAACPIEFPGVAEASHTPLCNKLLAQV